jgi:hypothetical protein
MINNAHADTLGADEDWTLVGDFNLKLRRSSGGRDKLEA